MYDVSVVRELHAVVFGECRLPACIFGAACRNLVRPLFGLSQACKNQEVTGDNQGNEKGSEKA